MNDAATTGEPVCSARRCGEDAVHALVWNNPRVHTPERRKTWLACPQHVDELARFLDGRGFLLAVVDISSLLDEPAQEHGSAAHRRDGS